MPGIRRGNQVINHPPKLPDNAPKDERRQQKIDKACAYSERIISGREAA